MPERLLLQASTSDVGRAIAFHAAEIDGLIANPDLTRSIAFHVAEIQALNRLVATDEDVIDVRVADASDRAGAMSEKFRAERAAEGEQAKQRAAVVASSAGAISG